MAGEEAPGQFSQRSAAVHGRRLTQPVGDSHVRMRAVDHRAPHDVAQETRPEEQVDQRLAGGRHTGGRQYLAELVPILRTVRGERADDHFDGAISIGGSHTLLFQPAGVHRLLGRRGERVQPPVVVRGDQVERAPVEPRDHHRPILGQGAVDIGSGEIDAPDPYRETEAAFVLGLHGADPTHNLDH